MLTARRETGSPSSRACIQFHDDIPYAQQRDGAVLAIRPICNGLGIDWRAQRKRINRDPVLAEGGVVMGLPFRQRRDRYHGTLWSGCPVMTLSSDTYGAWRGMGQMT